jgi:hypothetical protein
MAGSNVLTTLSRHCSKIEVSHGVRLRHCSSDNELFILRDKQIDGDKKHGSNGHAKKAARERFAQ